MSKPANPKTARALLGAANRASGDRVGGITVTCNQLVEALGEASQFVLGTFEQHAARENASKTYCLVNRKQLIEELEKIEGVGVDVGDGVVLHGSPAADVGDEIL